ncbi:right-handed parallel beta-helix repeat-containing protein [Gaoshiqia sp. Z1-71]|uniref:right-handed parallel beta-helix repeat-containing protein n=1 Tax=Gaoshiqia hydrogeniformans TaxID=3290090 RepID=UPI003BF8A28D
MKRIYLYLLSVLLIAVSCNKVNRLYVSPQGDDLGDGSAGKPFRTIEKARDVVREKRQEGNGAVFSVLLKEGDYEFTRSLEFDSRDRDLIIAACKQAKVRFTGGISIHPALAGPVSGTENEKIFPEYSREHIVMIDFKKLAISNFGELKQVGFGHPFPCSWMELFINGVPGCLSRWPNDSVVSMGEVIEKGSVPSEGDTANAGGVFRYRGNRPAAWKTSGDLWLSGYFRYGWADDAVKVAAIDTLEQTIATVQPHRYGFLSGKPYNTWYAYNIPEEIDAPGEYYIDRENGILYFYRPEKTETVEVSMLEVPFVVVNASSNITIREIAFECSRTHSVDLISASHCKLVSCTFRNLGSFAVHIGDDENGTIGKNNGLSGCTIEQTASGGVHLFGGNRQTLEAAGNYVENCRIHDFNRIAKTYCAGVQIKGVGNRITHCEIYQGPHCAVLMSGNDHLIEFNNIHDVCLVTDDVGALYYGRNPSERGHLVQFNYFHDLGQEHRTTAVYHDDGACGMTVFGNVFYRAGAFPSLIGGGSDNAYINNIFIDCPVGIKVDNRLQAYDWAIPMIAPGNVYDKALREIKHDQPPYSSKYPELASYWDDNPAFPKRNVVDKNIFVGLETVILGDKKFLEYGDHNYITHDDPGFVNKKEQDFRLRKDSDVFAKVPGFQAIPFEQIGLKKK